MAAILVCALVLTGASASLAAAPPADETTARPAIAATEPAHEMPGAASRDADAAATDIELDDDLPVEQPAFQDPFEPLNRTTFAFNRRVDGWVISPVARAYGWVVPGPVKSGVRNFFSNLESPVRLVNDLLQGEWKNAGSTFARFAINTVAGGVGFVDTASYVGIAGHDADFGQTLAAGGVRSGPYLVVPILGPTTLRDGFGALVDTAMNPAFYLTEGVSPVVSASIGTGAEGLAKREQHDDDLRRLKESSVDEYAAMRSAYLQNRMAAIGESGDGRRTEPTPAATDAATVASDAAIAATRPTTAAGAPTATAAGSPTATATGSPTATDPAT
ncbi:MAG TPA: VacJ family lipoprotein [Candidatus Binatia bacterium]|nr:VacJ family lipoprotein [Candidatus Binatia bacterium]